MNFAAVLLTGGESRRMGADKATVDFGGQPLWRRQLGILHELNPAEIFISTRTDPAWRPIDTRLVLDSPPSRGPLSGLAAVLAEMRADQLIVLAIDMPDMTADHLRSLCDRANPGLGVLPIVRQRAEPLAAIYPREASPHFDVALSGVDFSLQHLVSQSVMNSILQPVSIPKDEEKFYRNLNYPSDLSAMKDANA